MKTFEEYRKSLPPRGGLGMADWGDAKNAYHAHDAEIADKDRTIALVRALVEEWRWINGGAHFSHELLAALEGKQ